MCEFSLNLRLNRIIEGLRQISFPSLKINFLILVSDLFYTSLIFVSHMAGYIELR